MPNLTTFPVSSVGGLDLVTPPQLVAGKPGAAVRLVNYEALTEGGYRRIRGYTTIPFDGNVTDPGTIRAIHDYEGRPLLIKGTSIYSRAPDGTTWELMNAGNALSGTERGDICVMDSGPTPQALVCDGIDGGVPVVVERDGGGVITSTPVTPAETAGARFCVKYQDHIVIAGMPAKPAEVFVSTRFDATTFTGTGSWSFQVADKITGLRTFRGFLYVFCENSIYRVKNLEQSVNAVVEPVTLKIGCIDHFSIAEIGGDVMFLANDGLRYLGATERIDDVALNLQSTLVDSLLDVLAVAQGNVSATVISAKRQYRLFYYDTGGIRRGLLGTLSSNGAFSWSQTSDMLVEFIHSVSTGSQSVTYHADTTTLYQHDVGNTFDGTPFIATYTTPYFNMGDPSIRKRAHSMTVYLEAEDTASIEVTLRYDYENQKVLQPLPFALSPVVTAARFGAARFGTAVYGAIRFPLEEILLEGSGEWLQLEFKDDSDENARYTIRGFDLNFTAGGRI